MPSDVTMNFASDNWAGATDAVAEALEPGQRRLRRRPMATTR